MSVYVGILRTFDDDDALRRLTLPTLLTLFRSFAGGITVGYV